MSATSRLREIWQRPGLFRGSRRAGIPGRTEIEAVEYWMLRELRELMNYKGYSRYRVQFVENVEWNNTDGSRVAVQLVWNREREDISINVMPWVGDATGLIGRFVLFAQFYRNRAWMRISYSVPTTSDGSDQSPITRVATCFNDFDMGCR